MLANDEGMLQAPGTYPLLSVRSPSNPNRMWAFPVLGILFKLILLIPVLVWVAILEVGLVAMSILNSFVVLFGGHYWVPAYGIAVGFLRLQTKIWFYATGLSDRYPGFGLTLTPYEDFLIDVPMPASSSRGFAIPILGGFVRGILLIPFAIWLQIVLYGAMLAVLVASFPVLFTGRYPLSFLEMARDAQRLALSEFCYGLGLSDSYPSFSISMANPGIKWLFIALGILFGLVRVVGQLGPAVSGSR